MSSQRRGRLCDVPHRRRQRSRVSTPSGNGRGATRARQRTAIRHEARRALKGDLRLVSESGLHLLLVRGASLSEPGRVGKRLQQRAGVQRRLEELWRGPAGSGGAGHQGIHPPAAAQPRAQCAAPCCSARALHGQTRAMARSFAWTAASDPGSARSCNAPDPARAAPQDTCSGEPRGAGASYRRVAPDAPDRAARRGWESPGRGWSRRGEGGEAAAGPQTGSPPPPRSRCATTSAGTPVAASASAAVGRHPAASPPARTGPMDDRGDRGDRPRLSRVPERKNALGLAPGVVWTCILARGWQIGGTLWF